MRNIICFGAGDMGAEAYESFIRDLGYNIVFWTDNDIEKWNTVFFETYIKNPESIKRVDYPVFISCIYGKEITDQLISMGIERNRIWDLETLVKNSGRNDLPFQVNNEYKIVFDICNTSVWAGTELWSLRLADELSKKGLKVTVIVKEELPDIFHCDELEVIKLGKGNESHEMHSYLIQNQPVILVNSFSKVGMLEAVYMKTKGIDKIKVLSVLHNEDARYLRRHAGFLTYTDAVYAVSRKVKEKAKKYFEGKEISCFIQCVPIDSSFVIKKMWNEIRIAFASRIEKHQKRADLLPLLITELEKLHIDFVLNIAGTGEYEEQLRKWVKENNLNNRVRFWGFIDPSNMRDFWIENDIYLNLSDFEGFSLSMLEGMSYGLVPIVSNVSGVDEVINNGDNGFVFDNNDIEGYVDVVTRLSSNRELLIDLKKKARKTIVEKCDYNLFTDYFMDLIREIES